MSRRNIPTLMLMSLAAILIFASAHIIPNDLSSLTPFASPSALRFNDHQTIMNTPVVSRPTHPGYIKTSPKPHEAIAITQKRDTVVAEGDPAEPTATRPALPINLGQGNIRPSKHSQYLPPHEKISAQVTATRLTQSTNHVKLNGDVHGQKPPHCPDCTAEHYLPRSNISRKLKKHKQPGSNTTLESRTTRACLNFTLTNWLPDSDVWAYLFGHDSNGRYAFANPHDAETFYYPHNCSSGGNQKIDNSVIGFKLGGYNSRTTLTIPGPISAGRVYVSRGKLEFSYNMAANGQIGIVTPAVGNTADPNYAIDHAFMEFTWGSGGLTADISAVDFVGLPLGIAATHGRGEATNSVPGMRSTAVSDVCSALMRQSAIDGAAWDRQCLHIEGKSQPVRVLSPLQLLGVDPHAFDGYFDDYVKDVYSTYSTDPLFVYSASAGRHVQCSVCDGVLNCPGQYHSYTQPTAADIFGCASGGDGPFAIKGGNDGAIAPILCAAWNRGTLLLPEDKNFTFAGRTCAGSVQPCLPSSAWYPAGGVFNHYSRIVHESESRGQGYAFPYDDTNSPNSDGDSFGAAAAGMIFAADPTGLEIFVGGYDLAPDNETSVTRRTAAPSQNVTALERRIDPMPEYDPAGSRSLASIWAEGHPAMQSHAKVLATVLAHNPTLVQALAMMETQDSSVRHEQAHAIGTVLAHDSAVAQALATMQPPSRTSMQTRVTAAPQTSLPADVETSPLTIERVSTHRSPSYTNFFLLSQRSQPSGTSKSSEP